MAFLTETAGDFRMIRFQVFMERKPWNASCNWDDGILERSTTSEFECDFCCFNSRLARLHFACNFTIEWHSILLFWRLQSSTLRRFCYAENGEGNLIVATFFSWHRIKISVRETAVALFPASSSTKHHNIVNTTCLEFRAHSDIEIERTRCRNNVELIIFPLVDPTRESRSRNCEEGGGQDAGNG